MNQTVSVWLVILAALLAANLPFVNHRLLAVIPIAAEKALPWRLLELVFFYGLVGVFAWGMEQSAGQAAPQGWEFYATTFCLFLTLAFPGFVYRYLLKHRRGA